MLICAFDKNLNQVIIRPNNDVERVMNSFKSNSMVRNPHKFQIMFLGHNIKEPVVMYINGISINSTDKVKLLGVTIDKQLNFNEYIKNICNTANNKGNALSQDKTLHRQTQRLLCYAYILSHCNYCPLIWMFYSKTRNVLVNRTYKRAVRVAYENKHLSLEELLVVVGNVNIHVKNIWILMMQIFKNLMHINPEFMWDIFPENVFRMSLEIHAY